MRDVFAIHVSILLEHLPKMEKVFMKSIIIIIALFLVTLTAKADWVKKNGLEQVQLPDSNFFFTKVNDSCTKLLLVSQKNLKLYIVDLVTGKVDREQKIPYNFDICDYDFELESFVFYEYMYNNGNMLDGNKNYNASKILFKLKSNDTLEKFGSANISNNGSIVGHELYLLNIINHDLHLSYNVLWHMGHGTFSNEIVYRTFLNLNSTKVSEPKCSIRVSLPFQDGLFFRNNDTGYVGNTNGIFKIINTKEVNVMSDKFKILDIYDNYLSCKVDDNIIRYVEVNSGKTLNLFTYGTTTVPKITNYKLINSVGEAVFFKNDNNMYVLDNFTGKVTNTIPFVNGKLYYNKANHNLYSLKNSILYKTIITPNAKPNNEIIVSQSYYLFGDTIQLTKPEIFFYKNYSWEVNGVKYFDAQPKFQIKKAGSYDVKFNYVDSGITKTILKEKAILIVDSLKVNLTMNSQNGLIVGAPITFAASSNFVNTTYKWEIGKCSAIDDVVRIIILNTITTNTSATFTDYFDNIDGNTAKLTASNGYQTLIYNSNLNISSKLLLKADKIIGSFPLVVKLDAFIDCRRCSPYPSEALGLLQVNGQNISFVNRLSNYSYTFTKPGKYNIKISCGSDYNMPYNKTYNSFITVLDTTIFQAFPSRFKSVFANKYAFTQNSDGYYLEFDNVEADVEVYDNVGRLIKSYHIKDEQYIRKEDLERGVYFLEINVNGEVYHEKVLVE